MNSCISLTISIVTLAICASAQTTEQNPPICDPSQVTPSATILSDTKGGFGPYVTILSDTKGVDFAPYVSQAKKSVRQEWIDLIPTTTLKKGCVGIRFKIFPDGSVAEMKFDSLSGDVFFDRSAWEGLTAAEPFPPLPAQFKGDYLTILFSFFYNASPEIAGKISRSTPAPNSAEQANSPEDSALVADMRSLPAKSPVAAPETAKPVPDRSEIVPGRLSYKIDPVYPKEAKKGKIYGTAVLEVTVEKNGGVDDISILSGDLMLAEAAVDAVREWTFEPYTQSGSPVEARQQLTFNFLPGQKTGQIDSHLSPPTPVNGSGKPHPTEGSSPDTPYRVGHGVTPPKALYAPDPLYSEFALKAKYQGTCALSLIIGKNGEPRDIKVVRAMGGGLDIKAIDAVSTWRFQPATKDGQPVDVYATIEVQFHLATTEPK